MRWTVGLLLVVACSPLADDSPTPPSVAAVGFGTEILLDSDGPIAWRTDAAAVPSGDAAFFDGSWWTLVRDLRPREPIGVAIDFAHGDVITAVSGDIDGDGSRETVVSYRHLARPVAWDSRPLATDPLGRSAHIGVVDADGTPRWLARRIPHPIGGLAVCDTMVVLGYTDFEGVSVGATAAIWTGFGLLLEPELPWPSTIGCADVDGDGLSDPVVSRS